MRNTPISSTLPKRFLVARSTRWSSVLVALEVQHRVDDVLERLRAGDAAALRDVPDDEHRGAGLLREAHESRGALAHLADVARRAFEVAGEDGLDGVDDQHGRASRLPRWREPSRAVVSLSSVDVAGAVAKSVGAQLDLQRDSSPET